MFKYKYLIFILFYLLQAFSSYADLPQIIETFEKDIGNKEKLDKLISNMELENKYAEKYGGMPGKDYYKYYVESILNPALEQYLSILKKQSHTPLEEASLFKNLLTDMGAIRENIAKITTGVMFSPFGYLLRAGSMRREPINYFPAWEEYWRKRLESMVKVDLESLKCLDLIDKISEIDGKGQFKVIRITEKMLIITSPDDRPDLGYLEIDCPPGSTFPNLTLHISQRDDAQLTVVGTKFFAALDLDSPEPEELLEKLASFFLAFTHHSIYQRGQASIGEALLEGLARAHGYTISYSKEWTGPDYPSVDMHAMSTFNEAQFIKDFKDNVKLRKI